MPHPSQQPTATIHRFPIERRLGKTPAVARREPEVPNVPLCEFGSGWYHEAAMEAEPRQVPRKPRG